MSGIEIIGALSAIMTIAGQFADLSGRFRRCTKALSHAKEDIQGIEDETTIFTICLQMFHDKMHTMVKKKSSSARDARKIELVCRISRQSEIILTKTKNLLVKVNPLRTDKTHSRILRTLARWKWLADKGDVETLLRALDSAKLNLILFTRLLEMDNVNEEIARLRAAHKEVSVDIKRQARRYRKQVKQLKRQCEEAEWRCQKLQYKSLQRSGHDDHSETGQTSLLISIVKSELQQDRRQRSQRGSDLSSDAPSTPTGSQRQIITIEGGASDGQLMQSRTVGARSVDASTDDIAATRAHHQNEDGSANIIPQTDPPPCTELAVPRTDMWVPMPGWGEPRPQERPRAPRASQEDLPPGNVIYDDGTGVREEYRRPRRSRQDDFLDHDYRPGSGSAV